MIGPLEFNEFSRDNPDSKFKLDKWIYGQMSKIFDHYYINNVKTDKLT